MIGVLALAVIFCVVFLCGLFAFKETGLSEMRYPLAACVATLSVLGLLREIPTSSESSGLVVHVVLLPYAALGITLLVILLILLVLAIVRWWRRMGERRTGRARRERMRYEHKRTKNCPRG
jgi:hypothetical protein